MSESEPETGRHVAPDDDPNSDPPPVAGNGGDHRADGAGEEDDEEPEPARELKEGSEQERAPGVGSTRQPGADPEDEAEIEEERERRLDPDNRPDNVEVDNTQRDFDVEKGMFEDSEGFEEAEERFPPLGGQGA
jgi:hypothetical protein